MHTCPCGSGRPFSDCCAPLLSGERPPASAEALMRARYSAYVEGDIPFLGKSLHPDHQADYDEAATRRWADEATWIGLEVRDAHPGEHQGEEMVEFVASYRDKRGRTHHHHEIARFSQHRGRWVYRDGTPPPVETVVRETPRVGRNAPCPCGSGKKYKRCCGS